MKKLAICAFFCAGFAFITWLLLAMEIMDEIQRIGDESLFFLLLALPPVFQFVYTLKTFYMLDLQPFKSSERALDDFVMNDLDLEDKVVGTNFWLKSANTINCILLCGFFFIFTYVLRYEYDNFTNITYNEPSDFAMITALATYLVAVPCIVYNLRTFNLRRIKRSSLQI